MLSVASQYTGARRLGEKQRLPALAAQFPPAEIPSFDRPLGSFNVAEKIGVSEIASLSAMNNLVILEGFKGARAPREQFNIAPPSPTREVAGSLFSFAASMAVASINPMAGLALEAVNLIQDTRRFAFPSRQRQQPHEDGLEDYLSGQVRDRNTTQLQHHLNALLLLRAAQSRSVVTYDAQPDRPMLPAPAFIM